MHRTGYKGATDKSTLLGIEFQDSYDPTGATIIESWNGDINGNGSIKCYINGSGILIIAGNGFGKIIANENSSSLFDDFQNILTIVNLPLLDTSNVNTMSNMFYNCINLQELDLSNFDTSQVLNMNYMFSECKSLQSLDLSTFDFSLVETTSAMFRNCVLLSTIGFNYSKTDGDQMLNCTDMSYMFADCESLPLQILVFLILNRLNQ